jgi:hypothetical protein
MPPKRKTKATTPPPKRKADKEVETDSDDGHVPAKRRTKETAKVVDPVTPKRATKTRAKSPVQITDDESSDSDAASPSTSGGMLFVLINVVNVFSQTTPRMQSTMMCTHREHVQHVRVDCQQL